MGLLTRAFQALSDLVYTPGPAETAPQLGGISEIELRKNAMEGYNFSCKNCANFQVKMVPCAEDFSGKCSLLIYKSIGGVFSRSFAAHNACNQYLEKSQELQVAEELAGVWEIVDNNKYWGMTGPTGVQGSTGVTGPMGVQGCTGPTPNPSAP